MRRGQVVPTGAMRSFGHEEIIVSKTDRQGRITYANEVFVRVSAYTERELLGAPHSIIRHPAMPRAVFRLLWDTIGGGDEVFAYVLNLAADGVGYWVLAHVTPTYDATGALTGYHSSRRWPQPAAVRAVEPLYAQLLAEEARHPTGNAAVDASTAMLRGVLADAGCTYEEWVWGLVREHEQDV